MRLYKQPAEPYYVVEVRKDDRIKTFSIHETSDEEVLEYVKWKTEWVLKKDRNVIVLYRAEPWGWKNKNKRKHLYSKTIYTDIDMLEYLKDF